MNFVERPERRERESKLPITDLIQTAENGKGIRLPVTSTDDVTRISVNSWSHAKRRGFRSHVHVERNKKFVIIWWEKQA